MRNQGLSSRKSDRSGGDVPLSWIILSHAFFRLRTIVRYFSGSIPAPWRSMKRSSAWIRVYTSCRQASAVVLPGAFMPSSATGLLRLPHVFRCCDSAVAGCPRVPGVLPRMQGGSRQASHRQQLARIQHRPGGLAGGRAALRFQADRQRRYVGQPAGSGRQFSAGAMPNHAQRLGFATFRQRP
ncbi:hypothetical protein SAMN02745857_04189 [Andreprevotia lacus DSM 23236]|uniref:Uncharacterized protein n=1 Tax=Andreprevotia lacus DSM 23236 TaxID=1121001 RepID=A0A1W1Y267_9NEIS|nr:hypothetical protein SAMN02745857_04189 [Andreprevotia lacus DSM 23236]